MAANANALNPQEPVSNLLLMEQAQFKKQRSLWNNAWRQFRHHRLAMAGLIVLVFMVIAVTIGPFLWIHDPAYIDFMAFSQGPSWNHPMGTDDLGRDILARILIGGRISLAVGVCAAAISILLGTMIGALAGFFGGKTDTGLMRLTDLFISLPQLPLLLLMSFLFKDYVYDVFDERFNNGNLGTFILIVVVISILAWMPTARLVRAEFLRLKEKEFVEAARSIGAGRSPLIFRHILPNVLSPIIVAATLAVGSSIILESTLSFLGLGFPSDVATWGSMLYVAKDWLQLAPHQALFPGFMIFITVLSINYMGDGLRDALDPRKTQ